MKYLIMNKKHPMTLALALFVASGSVSFAQAPKLGLNFASTDPDAATSSLNPADVAGVDPQANWNNLELATGSATSGLVYDVGGSPTASGVSVTWSSPNTWRSGGNNAFPAGPDARLLSGYLDTGNTAANGISITVENLDSVFTETAYDVYVYFVSDSTANRGGGYTIDDGNVTLLQYGSTMAAPSEYVQDPGDDPDLSADGTHLRFIGLTGSSFTLTTDTTLTTPNGFRAPVNAIQILPTVPFGPDIIEQPSPVALYAGRTARFTASADGFPPVTSLQWRKDGVALTDDARISGSTTGTLTISDVSAADEGDYTLAATSTEGTATSDAAGLSIVTPATADYITDLLAANPLAHWRLNEESTVDDAFEHLGGLTGDYNTNVVHGSGVAGPEPATFPGFESGNTSVEVDTLFGQLHVDVPSPALEVNTATLIAWIQPFGEQFDFTGLFMTRDGTAAGLGYSTDNQLGYTWNNNSAATYNWASGLRPPNNQWSFVALVIEPERATLYMGTDGALNAAINPIEHISEAWGGAARIGDDAGGANFLRSFWGRIDEVAMFDQALSFEEVAGLYEAASGVSQTIPPVISPQPQSTTRYAGTTVRFQSGATGASPSYQWQKDGVDVTDGGRISGATTPTLTISEVETTDEGDYTLVVTNPYGESTSDPATLSVLPIPAGYVADVLDADPLSYWRLNETGDPSTGTQPAFDYWAGRNGTYGAAAQNGFHQIEGPRPEGGFASFETDNNALQLTLNTADSWATVPGPGVTTDTLTILAWINPATLVNNAGIAFARAGQPATGLNLNGTGLLGYHWLDAAATYNFVSGITVPLNQWSLAAVVVEPEQATLHLLSSSGTQSATNLVTHAPREFSDNIRIGGDPNNVNRTFNGRIDEVAIFDHALTIEEIEVLHETAIGAAAPAIAAHPESEEVFAGVSVQFTVAASGMLPLSYQWQKETGGVFNDLADGGNISGATSETLTITGVTAADAGQYRAVVSNTQGSATSDPATLTLLPTPPAPDAGSFGAAVLDSGGFAYWRLNETVDPSTGSAQVYDYAGTRHALYGVAALNGFSETAGPRPADGFDVFEASNYSLRTTANLANSWVTTPALGFTTDTLTIVAWINPVTLPANAGIVFARAGQPATGMNLNGAGNIGYHWLDAQTSWSWDSGLTPPLEQWSLVAIVVEPTQATAHLINADGTQSAVNAVTHAARNFTDTIRIGGDPNNVNRTFDGSIDEVAIFDRALTSEQVLALFNGDAVALPPELEISLVGGEITITWDQAGTLQSTEVLEGTATVWTDETTTGNSLTVTPTGPAKYYRLVQ